MRSMLFLVTFALAAAPAQAAETVPVKAFKSVQLRGGGSVSIRPGATQRVTLLSGSTRFTTVRVDDRGRLRIEACNARCPRDYDLQVEIVTPLAPDAAASGGGAMTFARGFRSQPQLSLAVSGGARINARAVSAASLSVAASGGGRVLTGSSRHLSAAVSGGAEVRYIGTPRVSSVVSGGGTIRRDK